MTIRVWKVALVIVWMLTMMIHGSYGSYSSYNGQQCPAGTPVRGQVGQYCDGDLETLPNSFFHPVKTYNQTIGNNTVVVTESINMTHPPLICQDGLSCVENKCTDVLIYTDCKNAPQNCGRYFDCMYLSHLPDLDSLPGDDNSLFSFLGFPSRGKNNKNRPECAGRPLEPMGGDHKPVTQCVVRRFAGEACEHPEECWSGKCTPNDCGGGGTCTGTVMLDPCNSTQENTCGVNMNYQSMYCEPSSQTCMTRKKVNDACSMDTKMSYSNFMAQCGPGLMCSAGICSEMFSIPEKGSCDPFGAGRPEHRPFSPYFEPDVCAYGLKCDAVSKTCVKSNPIACSNDTLRDCPSNTQCTCDVDTSPEEPSVTPSGMMNGNGLFAADGSVSIGSPMCQTTVNLNCKREALKFRDCMTCDDECNNFWSPIGVERTNANTQCLSEFDQLVCCFRHNGFANNSYIRGVCPTFSHNNDTEDNNGDLPPSIGWFNGLHGPSTLGQWIATGVTFLVIFSLVGCHLHRQNKCPRWTGLNRQQTFTGKARYGRVINRGDDEDEGQAMHEFNPNVDAEMGHFEVGDLDSSSSDDDLEEDVIEFVDSEEGQESNEN